MQCVFLVWKTSTLARLVSVFHLMCSARLTAPRFLLDLDGNTSGHAVRQQQKSLLLLQRLPGIWAKGLYGSMTSHGADEHRQADARAAHFLLRLFVCFIQMSASREWHLSNVFTPVSISGFDFRWCRNLTIYSKGVYYCYRQTPFGWMKRAGSILVLQLFAQWRFKQGHREPVAVGSIEGPVYIMMSW